MGTRAMESIMDSRSTGISPSQQSESSVMLRVAKLKGKRKENTYDDVGDEDDQYHFTGRAPAPERVRPDHEDH